MSDIQPRSPSKESEKSAFVRKGKYHRYSSLIFVIPVDIRSSNLACAGFEKVRLDCVVHCWLLRNKLISKCRDAVSYQRNSDLPIHQMVRPRTQACLSFLGALVQSLELSSIEARLARSGYGLRRQVATTKCSWPLILDGQ